MIIVLLILRFSLILQLLRLECWVFRLKINLSARRKLRVPDGPAHHRLAKLEPCCYWYLFAGLEKTGKTGSSLQRQAHSQDQFWEGCMTPKSGPFEPKKWTFWTSPPYPPAKTSFVAHFVAKSGPFCRFGGASHPHIPLWLRACAEKFCDLEEKNKEIHKGNPPTMEGNLPCWREILHSLQGNKDFFQACLFVVTETWNSYIPHLIKFATWTVL